MILVPADISRRDLTTWMSEGVCLLDGETPVIMREVGDRKINLREVATKRARSIPWAARGERLSVHWPKCGSLNLDRFAVYLKRRQVRQYRRTYNARTLTLHIPGKWDAMKLLDPESLAVNPKSNTVVAAAFAPTYYEWDDAVDMLRDDWFSVAISPYVILARQGEDMAVFYRGRRAGLVQGERFVPNGYDIAEPRMFKLMQGRVIL